MDGISIIVTAYKTQNYIEECLDSIQAQTWFHLHNNYEILLGIDNCEDTLQKVETLADRYNNLTIIYMDKNYGTYITSNTLISLAKYDWIIRFDSDDIMKPDMVQSVFDFLEVENKTDVIRFYGRPFSTEFKVKETPVLGHGQLCINKSVFEKYGAFQPWICAADGEFLTRLENKVNIKGLPKITFLYRKHFKSLTKDPSTDMKSELRKGYIKYIHEKCKDNPIIETLTGDYKIITDNYSDIINASIDKETVEPVIIKPRLNPVSKKIYLRSKHSYCNV